MLDPDAPKPRPSWLPVRGRQEERRRAQIAAAIIFALGALGVGIGVVMPEASTELLLGTVLILLAARALLNAGEETGAE